VANEHNFAHLWFEENKIINYKFKKNNFKTKSSSAVTSHPHSET
jgi:hypothetical protein